MRTRKFHISVRSVLAAFLLVGGLQGMILSLRNPMVAAAIGVTNWLINRIKPDYFRLNRIAVSWDDFSFQIAIAIVLLILAVSIGAGVRSSVVSGKSAS